MITRSEDKGDAKPITGSQTLIRGLNIIEAVSRGASSLNALSNDLGLTRSTTYRLASALVERDYLVTVPRGGYALGPRLEALSARPEPLVSTEVTVGGHRVATLELCRFAMPVSASQMAVLGEAVRLCAKTIGDRLAPED
ncbi:MAG: hypothetical protein B7Z26_03030 [Asticcacaulis sp. 32-58-5]|nr:MAG: hypothetical protein B7Z26_03030 [Asticcacaulis sp. 32-58-5]